MACKTAAEQWNNVRPHVPAVFFSNSYFGLRPQYLKRKKKNVVEIRHNIKVVVAGAQMTTNVVAKEE